MGRYRFIGGIYPTLSQAEEVVIHSCEDCGAVVRTIDKPTHDRFHAILNDQARAVAVLVNVHLSAATHDRYNVRERIGKGSGNNWSAEAFAEVAASIEAAENARTPSTDDEVEG